MKHYTILGYQVDCVVEKVYYSLAEEFIKDNDNFYVPRLLKYMISPEAAQVCLEMPGTAEEISQKLGCTEEEIEKRFKESIVNGVAHRNLKNGKVNFANSIVNLADFGIVNPKILEKRGKAFLDLVKGIRTSIEYIESFTEELDGEKDKEHEEETKEPIFRVLPRWKAIKDIPGVMPCENLYEILKEQEKISTVRCMCRSVMRNEDVTLEGSEPEEGHCVKFGPVAQHFVEEMGLGRYRSPEEVMDNLSVIEEQPIYHMIGNSREQRGGFCNCCADCCDMRMEANSLPSIKDGIRPSRFLAVFEKEHCMDCGRCLEVCPFSAIKKGADHEIIISEEACMGCGICAVSCKYDALSLIINKPVEFIPEKGTQHIEESLNLAE